MVGIHDPEDLKVLLRSSNLDKGYVYEGLKNWLGNGLVTCKGDVWGHQRRLCVPAFDTTALHQYFSIFNENSQLFCAVIREDSNKTPILDAHPYISRCTLDTIVSALSGRRLNSQIERENSYSAAVERLLGLAMYRSYRPWYKYDWLWRLSSSGKKEAAALQVVHGFAQEVISERKKKRIQHFQNNPNSHALSSRGLLIDILINRLSDNDIREQFDTFVFAGQDTTAAHIGWTLLLLAKHQHHQEIVQAELDSIFALDKSRHIQEEDLKSMKYLEICIKESLRLYPPVSCVSRRVTSSIHLEDSSGRVTLPMGCEVFTLPYHVHSNEEIFPNPKEFDPLRFSYTHTGSRNPYAYIPFSKGPRSCIGEKFALAEVLVFLGNVFRRFHVTTPMDLENLVSKPGIIHRSRHGILLSFKERELTAL